MTTDRKNFIFSAHRGIMAEKRITGCGSTGRARHLGCRGWVFKSPHSDQNPSEIIDFRGIFLFFVYCGAEFEVCRDGNEIANISFSPT